MEQTRLGEQLARYLRLDPHSNFLVEEAKGIHESAQGLHRAIQGYTNLLIHQALATDTVRRVGLLNERLDIYATLEAEFFKTLPRAKLLARRRDTSGGRLYEGFEAAALTVLDAVESGEADDIALALRITEDGSDTLSRLRQGFVETTREAAPREQAELLQLVAGVERLIWLMNSLARSLEHAAARPVVRENG
jgi:hypothetical protein